MDEKRKFIRFRVSFPFKFAQDEYFPKAKVTVKDINMKGLKVVLDKAFCSLIEKLTKFHLVLPGDNVLEASGEVIWERDYLDRREAGIRFVHIPDGCKENIYNYISKYHRQELTQEWWQM